MKSCPDCRRSYADETFSFCLEDGSLLSAPNIDPEETIIRPRIFKVTNRNAQTAILPKTTNFSSSISIDHPVVAINIHQQFPYVRNAEELYEVTRGLWRLRKERADKAHFAFAVYKGDIKEVYEIDFWQPAKFDSSEFWIKRKKEQGEEINPTINEGRYQFVRRVAPENIRNIYVGQKMPVAHTQNPIRYFNC